MSNEVLIPIKVVPKANRNEILGFENGQWRIRIAAVPAKGDANKELIRFLAKTLGIARSNLSIHSGSTSRHKRVACTGLPETKIQEQLHHASTT